MTPQHPTTHPLSAITYLTYNSPTIHSNVSSPATPKPIAAGGSSDHPVFDAKHPSENRSVPDKGASLKESNKIDSKGGSTRRYGNERSGPYSKKQETLSAPLLLNNFIIDSTHFF